MDVRICRTLGMMVVGLSPRVRITTVIAAIYNRYFSLDRLWGGADK